MCHLRLQWWAESWENFNLRICHFEYRNCVQDLKLCTIFCPMFFKALFSMVCWCALTNFDWKKASPSYQTCHMSHLESSGAKDPWNHSNYAIFRVCGIFCGWVPLRPHITASKQEVAFGTKESGSQIYISIHFMRYEIVIFNSRFYYQISISFVQNSKIQPPTGPFTDLVALFGARHWADGPGTTHGRTTA